jgi:hypothetical protein
MEKEYEEKYNKEMKGTEEHKRRNCRRLSRYRGRKKRKIKKRR